MIGHDRVLPLTWTVEDLASLNAKAKAAASLQAGGTISSRTLRQVERAGGRQ